MRFSREMNHRTHPVLGQQPFEQLGIGNVALQENVPRIAIQGRQILQVAGIGEFVQIHHRLVAAGQPVQNEIAANETGAACYKNHENLDYLYKYIVLVDFCRLILCGGLFVGF